MFVTSESTVESDPADPVSRPDVAAAQIAAFRDWERFTGDRFVELRGIRQPVGLDRYTWRANN